MDIYCGNCGQKNDPSAKFCESCGNPLSPIQPPIPDKPMQNVSSNVSINTGQSKKKQSQSSTTYILIGGIALIVIIVFVIAAIILVKNRVPVSALNNQSTLIPAITNSATIQQPTNDQCSIVWQRFMQSYSQNFDLVSGNWRGRFGCANGLSCTNETWIAQEKSNGCDISYQLEVNGVEKTVGMFYIDLNTDKISASDDPNNFGVPEESIEWVANSTNSQSFLNTVMPPSTLATIEAMGTQVISTSIPELTTQSTPEPTSNVPQDTSVPQGNGSCSYTPPSITASGLINKITMAEDTQGANKDPVNPTTVFQPSATIHAVVAISKAPANTRFKAIWFATDVENTDCNTQVGEPYELTTDGTRNIDFILTPNSTWPTGSYRVEIYVNDSLDQVVVYTVQ